ncbi:MAG: hypothetical protein ACYCW6_08210 [Candidatus Xenobia bacterium]
MSDEGKRITNLQPDVMPTPTYMPAVVALGISLLVWGIITSPIILIAGLGILVLGVAGWIGDLKHESEHGGHGESHPGIEGDAVAQEVL